MDDLISKLSEIRSKYNCLDEAEEPYYRALSEAIKKLSEQADGDTISRQAAIDAVKKNTFRLTFAEEQNCEGHVAWSAEAVYSDVMKGALLELPSAQLDVITASLEELINDYGEDGYFIVDGVNYQANELLNELKINSSVGEKFRKQITKTIVAYFMKFGD